MARAAAITAKAYRLRSERKPRARIHIDQSAIAIKRVVSAGQRGCCRETHPRRQLSLERLLLIEGTFGGAVWGEGGEGGGGGRRLGDE